MQSNKNVWIKINKSKRIVFFKILDFKVKTRKYGDTGYANLDNAATTPHFSRRGRNQGVFDELQVPVHRGAGIKSKISTDIYEESRK